MNTKEQINEQLNQLNEEQLNQVADFITFLKFREKLIKLNLNTEQLAQLYQEFAEEDRQVAEEGINEYAGLLIQEERGGRLTFDLFSIPYQNKRRPIKRTHI